MLVYIWSEGADRTITFIYKGLSINDVHRDGGGGLVKCGQGGVKDLANVRKLVLFFIVSACFADTLSVDDAN